MYTETIDRKIAAYVELAKCGIFAHRLEGSYSRKSEPWSLEISIVGNLSPQQCKTPVLQYLERVYGATCVVFKKRSSHKANQFYVQFMRGDL